MQLGEEGVEAGALGEEEPREALEEAQVGASSLGTHAKLHYGPLVGVNPKENQKLSAMMGWVGLGQEVEE